MEAPDLLSGRGARNPISVELATLIHRILQTRKSFVDAGQLCHLFPEWMRSKGRKGFKEFGQMEWALMMNVCHHACLQLRTENIDIRRFATIIISLPMEAI